MYVHVRVYVYAYMYTHTHTPENANHRLEENTCKEQVSRICNKLLQLNKKIDSPSNKDQKIYRYLLIKVYKW